MISKAFVFGWCWKGWDQNFGLVFCSQALINLSLSNILSTMCSTISCWSCYFVQYDGTVAMNCNLALKMSYMLMISWGFLYSDMRTCYACHSFATITLVINE